VAGRFGRSWVATLTGPAWQLWPVIRHYRSTLRVLVESIVVQSIKEWHCRDTFSQYLLTHASVRCLAPAAVGSTMVPRPWSSEESANKHHQHQLSRREIGYASYGDLAGDTIVDDSRCLPHGEVAELSAKSLCMDFCLEQ